MPGGLLCEDQVCSCAGSLSLRPSASSAVLASFLASRWVRWLCLWPLPGEPHLCQLPMPT